MGYLDGFLVTFRKLRQAAERHASSRPSTRRRSAPKPARLHGRHVLNRYEDGMEKCIGCELCAGVCPARCIYVRGADNPPDDPVSPGRALRLRLRDQLPALHPLRPVRRGVPDRGDHRDEAVRVLASPTATTPSTPRTSCSSTTTAGPSSCRGRTGDAERGRAHVGLDAGHRAVGQRRVRGPGRVVGRARLRRARPGAGPEPRPEADALADDRTPSRTTRHDAEPTTPGTG